MVSGSDGLPSVSGSDGLPSFGGSDGLPFFRGALAAWVNVAACRGDGVPYEFIRFPYLGTAHRPHALRIRVDAAGLEYLDLASRSSERTKDGALA
jgi:hypothetical protein